MSVERLVFVTSETDAPAPMDNTAVVVLDTAWTPGPDSRPDLVPIRRAIGTVLEKHDLVEESIVKIDAWAEAMEVPDLLQLDGVSWWPRRRSHDLAWLQRRLLWRRAIEVLLECGTVRRIELRAREPELAEMLDLLAADGRFAYGAVLNDEEAAAAPVVRPSPPRRAQLRRLLGLPRRHLRRRVLASHTSAIDHRRRRLAGGTRPRVLVLSSVRTEQVVDGPQGPRRVDPFLAPVIDRLDSEGFQPVVIGLGLDRIDDATWRVLANDSRLLPGSILEDRFSQRSDSIAARQLLDAVVALEALPGVALDADDVDLSRPLLASLRHFVRRGLVVNLRELANARRLMEELKPAAIMLVNEYSRTPWLAAARDAGIPTFAIQHGVIYPWHAGYRHRRDRGLVLPTRTFVFGPYERRVLLEYGGYLPDEVVVVGAPRHDLLETDLSQSKIADADRALRQKLGVRDGDKCLVVSTTWDELHRRFYLTQALSRVFGGLLPGVHVVFKLHPAESDEGPYRTIVEGVAREGGHEPPRMTVVRDVDLYRLLAIADAHLGLFSTVLTDAVAAGVPNLIAVTQAHRDLLGYVDAGVATPVASAAELHAAILQPTVPDAVTRRQFLEDHFLPGDASGRIVSAIRQFLDTRGAAA